MTAIDETDKEFGEGLDAGRQAVSAAASKTVDALDLAIELLEDIQKVVSSGRPKTFRIRFGDKTIAEIPVALTAVMAFVAGVAAVMLTKLAIEVEHES
ncbi:MAG: DUF4342 domain-containing protein [Armatimonadetes bacterium]|nr:DUF4342 domain-containing protein [Armatimonadota bacterium]